MEPQYRFIILVKFRGPAVTEKFVDKDTGNIGWFDSELFNKVVTVYGPVEDGLFDMQFVL